MDNREVVAETFADTVSRMISHGFPRSGPQVNSVELRVQRHLQDHATVADSTLVVCSGKTVAEIEMKINQALEALTRWIESAGLYLATQKTEQSRRYNLSTFRLKDLEIGLCTFLKYSGLWFNRKLSFQKHIQVTAEKANRKLVPSPGL